MGCTAAGEWADFPMLGFNKNWVAIGWNPFTITTNGFIAGKVLAIDYPTMRTGTANGTLFSGIAAGSGGFCLHPATTFSTTEETLYIPTHIGSAGATYRLHSLTGTPAAPTFNLDAANRTRTGGGWTQPGGDIAPQQCIPGVGLPTQTCPATIRRIDSGDAFIRSNVVFRNGKIWYPQTVSLPAGTAAANDAARLAAQWTVLNPDGTFSDGGRVEDPTATKTNGGKHYFYPSITVNKNNDAILGFSEAESDDYVDAGYTVRFGTDAASTMRDPVIYKEGEDYYSKTFGGTRNRWGDYSHSVIDPVNDRDLWTIQEYAMLRVGATGEGSNDSRWGTWWAKVTAPVAAGDLVISEFRVRGPSGANDEFIEIYNASGADHTVADSGAGTGYAVAASDGVARCVIPNGTVIPNRGHYLCTNSVAYSLSGNATGNATYTTDIPDNAGIALFNTVDRRQLHAREPARRGRLDERGEHALQGRDGLSGLDARSRLTTRSTATRAARAARSHSSAAARPGGCRKTQTMTINLVSKRVAVQVNHSAMNTENAKRLPRATHRIGCNACEKLAKGFSRFVPKCLFTPVDISCTNVLAGQAGIQSTTSSVVSWPAYVTLNS